MSKKTYLEVGENKYEMFVIRFKHFLLFLFGVVGIFATHAGIKMSLTEARTALLHKSEEMYRFWTLFSYLFSCFLGMFVIVLLMFVAIWWATYKKYTLILLKIN